MVSVRELGDIANVMREDSLAATTAAGSGHPTSCLSCAELMAVLFFREMKWDVSNSENPNSDEFILSKGHAAPILYSALHRAKALKEDLLRLRKIDSGLEGHPMPRSLKWVKVGTGSLGQGLSVGIGMALAGKLQKRKFRTYVLLGDSEIAEGSVYEGLQLAAYYGLNNLTAVVDVNKLGQRGETMVGHRMKVYAKRFKSFGWHVEVVNGHKIRSVIKAFDRCESVGRPSVILAKTVKGKGISFLEGKDGWHGKPLKPEEMESALGELKGVKMPVGKIEKPRVIDWVPKKGKAKVNSYKIGEMVATRAAYGKALASLARARENVIAVDAEVSNSTQSEGVKKVRKKQFVETFIAEQNLAGICLGLSKKGFDVYGSTFGAFLTRAHDQIRMAALSSANLTFCGSHAGVEIGADGASQMGLEDIAMFRALPESVVFYPCDAVSTEKIVKLCGGLKRVKYIRTTRGKTPVVYKNTESFRVGGFKVLKQGKKDRVVLAGAGVTLHECLKASESLKNCAVVDLYCLKPFDGRRFRDFVKKHGGKVVVVEDHYAEGGVGEMVSGLGLKVEHLAVREIPHSGKPEELLEKYGIDSKEILRAAKKLI